MDVHDWIRAEIAEEIAGGGCEVCAHSQREELEFVIFSVLLANDSVAQLFPLSGGGGPVDAERVRQHRCACVTQPDRDLLMGREHPLRHRDSIVAELRRRRLEVTA